MLFLCDMSYNLNHTKLDIAMLQAKIFQFGLDKHFATQTNHILDVQLQNEMFYML